FAREACRLPVSPSRRVASRPGAMRDGTGRAVVVSPRHENQRSGENPATVDGRIPGGSGRLAFELNVCGPGSPSPKQGGARAPAWSEGDPPQDASPRRGCSHFDVDWPRPGAGGKLLVGGKGAGIRAGPVAPGRGPRGRICR